MISPEEMRVLDKNCEFFGVSVQELMEKAGMAVADAVVSKLDGKGKKVLILCGTGNNGGDGLTAARHLKDNARVTVILARSADKLATREAAEAYQRVKRQGSMMERPHRLDEMLSETDIVVDGLLGIGMRGETKKRTRR